jgi:prepilin-type N-terminal cleavage/methylation domain-containing protein
MRHETPLVNHGGVLRSGYTLTELLIVMMVVSIVMVTAMPPMWATVRGTRLEAARQELIGDLRLARMEAIRRNVSIAVQKTSATSYTIDSIGARTLRDGVMFSSAPETLRFAPFGPVPTGSATYALRLNGKSGAVRVSTAGNATAE